MCTTAEVIKACAADKLQLNRANDDLSLVEVKSNGERTIYKDSDVSVPTALGLNGRIFVSPKDHLDALVSINFIVIIIIINIISFIQHGLSLFISKWLNFYNNEMLFVLFSIKTPLPEQEMASEGLDIDIEVLSTKELAYHITLFDWDLFWAVHEYELLYHTFGRHHFGKVSIRVQMYLYIFLYQYQKYIYSYLFSVKY